MKLGNSTFKQILDYIYKNGNSIEVITDPVLIESDDDRYTKMYKFDVTNAVRTSILAVYKKEINKYISIPFDFTIENNTIRLLLNTDNVSKILYTDKLIDNKSNDIDLSNYANLVKTNTFTQINNFLNTIMGRNINVNSNINKNTGSDYNLGALNIDGPGRYLTFSEDKNGQKTRVVLIGFDPSTEGNLRIYNYNTNSDGKVGNVILNTGLLFQSNYVPQNNKNATPKDYVDNLVNNLKQEITNEINKINERIDSLSGSSSK